LIALAGCGRHPAGDGAAAPVHGKLKFLALGDSYTIGQSVAPSQRWPVQLAGQLRARGIDISDPIILARTGWTTDELLAAMDQAKPDGGNDLVTLLIGVNDQYRGYDTRGFSEHFDTLLRRAAALASGGIKHVVVLSIPDWGLTPFGRQSARPNVSSEIDQFNAIAKDRTEHAGAVWVNISDVSREVADDSTLVADDGLHPSGKLYERWAELTAPAASALLKYGLKKSVIKKHPAWHH
jgi:lysophospholipase L1-like esterase